MGARSKRTSIEQIDVGGQVERVRQSGFADPHG
jgi:hypothetical protein